MNKIETHILELVKRRQHDKAEGFWLEMAENPSNDMDFYRKIVGLLSKSKNKKRLNEWGNVVLTNLVENERFRLGMQVGRLFAKGVNGPCDFLPHVTACVHRLNRRRSNLDKYIELSELEKNENVSKSITILDLMLYNDIGEVFAHDSFGIGKIIESDPEKQKVVIEYEGGESHEFSYQGTREYLRKYPNGHFHSLRLKNPKKFKEKAFDKPTEFLKIVLKSFNRGIKIDELKSILTESFFTLKEWKDWWKKSKDIVVHDAYIELTNESRGTFRLRENPKEYIDVLCERFIESDSASARLSILQEAHKQFNEEQYEKFTNAVNKSLLVDFEENKDKLSRKITCAFLWEDLHKAAQDKVIPGWDEAQSLSNPEKVINALLSIDSFDYQNRLLERYAKHNPENYPELYAEILLKTTPKLAGWLVKQLEEKGHTKLLSFTVERMISRPLENTDLCVWGLKQYFDGKWDHFYQSEIPHVHLADMLDAMETLAAQIEVADNSTPLRNAFNKIKNFLWDKHCRVIQNVIEKLSVEDAVEFMTKIRKNPAIPGDYIAEAASAVRKVRDDLDLYKKEEKQSSDSDLIYVTETTLKQRQDELQNLITVEIPKNSKDIGEAASLGDLKENAEYHAAKEYQKVIHRRKEELTGLISKAKVIDLENVTTDQVKPGTSFRALNKESNEEESFTILGFWDAKPDEGILNYMSPLAQQFLEKKEGEEVTIELPAGGTQNYKILEISKAVIPE